MRPAELLILSGEDVRALAPVDDLIGWMREAMILTSKRDVALPLRRSLDLPDGMGMIGMMPGYLGGDIASAGVKLVSLVPPARRKGSSHLGLMVLYEADGLVPIAVLCGATVTAVRTSAMTAAASEALANRDAKILTIVGGGEQALAHARALRRIRDFSEFRMWSYDPAEASRFVDELKMTDNLDFTALPTVAEAVRGADVICTTTSASEPILFGEMISPGAHVNLVGSSHRDAAEADTGLVARAEYFIDFKPSTMDQAAELLRAIEEGAVSETHIKAEIGEVLAGAKSGRSGPDAITVYKSVGVASQDIITARRVYDAARAQGRGKAVAL